MKILLGIYSLFSRGVCRGRAFCLRARITRSRIAPMPVLSIGNLTLGGSEKTPLVMEILAWAERLKRKPALISRGYRGSWERGGGVLSDGKNLLAGWPEAGDEPAMIARRFPQAGVFVGRHKFRSCLKAAEAGFDVAVLDDAFQHLKLGRDADIVIHDPQSRSPLREGLSALRRAHILLLKKEGGEAIKGRAFAAEVDPRAKPGAPAAVERRIRAAFPSLPVFEYDVAVRGLCRLGDDALLPLSTLAGRKIAAFCGIARPERFFALLARHGCPAEIRTAFPDHFAYPDEALAKIAAARSAPDLFAFVTTEKDAVKLLGRADRLSPIPVYVVRIGLDLPPSFFQTLATFLPPGPRTTHG